MRQTREVELKSKSKSTTHNTCTVCFREGSMALHAHIDCSKGLSSQSLYLAASGELAKQLNHPEAASLGEQRPFSLQRVLDQLFQRAGSKLDGVDHWLDVLAKQQHEQSFSGKGEDENEISALAIQTLKLLKEGSEESSQLKYVVNVSAIFGTFWWFKQLGFSSVSCSPLSCETSVLSKRPQLYKDMPVQLMDSSSSPRVMIEDEGVALLKVLLKYTFSKEEDYKNFKHGRPNLLPQDSCSGVAPCLSFQFSASACYDYPFAHKTTIVVGRILETSTPPKNGSCTASHAITAEFSPSLFGDDVLEKPDLWKVDRDMCLLETNIDDMTAEHLSFAAEQLMTQGAADCWLTPIVMKKGRAAHTLHCLCRNSQCPDILTSIFRHCTTLGVRVRNHQTGLSRVVLRRETLAVPVEAEWAGANNGLTSGKITFDGCGTPEAIACKVGYLGKEVVSVKAEFEQCRQLSLSTDGDVPIQYIADKVVHKAHKMIARRPTT